MGHYRCDCVFHFTVHKILEAPRQKTHPCIFGEFSGNIKRPPRNSDFQNWKILSAPLARRRRENFEVLGYFVWISKGVLNYFVWTLKILSAPHISRDFEKILSAPLEIQIFKKINIKRPPDLVPGGALKGGF